MPKLAAYGLGTLFGGEYGGAVSDLLRVPYADEMLVKLDPRLDPMVAAALGDNAIDGWRTVAPALSRAATIAHNAALTFKFLLSQCAAEYPGVQVPTSDEEVLSAMQRGRNYNAIAKCAYEKFSAKPYWIPQLVDDVDICATELGKDWRLPAEADIAALSDADIEFLNRTLTETTTGSGMLAGADLWGKYYFALAIYIRGTDGVLKVGDLTSGVTGRVSALGVPPAQYKNHFERSGSPLALRCIHWTAVP